MHKTLRQACETPDFKGLFEFVSRHEGPLTEPFEPEAIDYFKGIVGMDDPYPNICSRVPFELIRLNQFSEQENGQLCGLYMQRLRHDSAALNWCVHDMLCNHSIAGNDAHLFNLICKLDADQKLALVAAEYQFWELESLKDIHVPHLIAALKSIKNFCQQPEMNCIEWLATNEQILQSPGDKTLCSSGNIGTSGVVLEASPISTLPRSLIYAYSGILTKGEVFKLSSEMEELPIASDMWLKVVYKVAGLVRDLSYENALGAEPINLDWLSLEASGAVITWTDIAQHSWNGFYPTTAIDHVDMTTFLKLLKLKPFIASSDYASVVQVLAQVYHHSEIDGAYASGFHDLDKDDFALLTTATAHGVGKLMFEQSGIDCQAVIDRYLEDNEQLIASSLTCRALSPSYSFPKPGMDLLCIINHKDPQKKTGHYAHAVVKIHLMALRFIKEQCPEDDVLILLGKCRELLCHANTSIDKPWPMPAELEKAYAAMPERLKSPDARLALGLPLTKKQLQQANPELRERSFSIDLGL